MNKESLKEYLSSRYQGWSSFLNNVIFPIFGEDDFEDGYEAELLESQPERRQLAETTGIRSIKQVGMMYVGVEPLQIFDVTVSDRVMMERNRVNIQRLIRAVMDQFSCAFMLFHYEDDTRWDWRFTYCRKSGNKEESTDSKRYTFLLGPGQSCRTATDNFMNLYNKRESLEIKDIENAFNVEALSDEFFDEYKKQYELFINYMIDPAHGMRQDFIDTDFDHTGMTADKVHEREEKPIRDYVKKLLGRIVFLHFLQKKGWLGVPAGKDWGEGDHDFMLKLFQNASEQQKSNFLDDILEDLFAEGLDRNRSDKGDLYDTEVNGIGKCRIPYLNGGLFERDELDKKQSRFPAEYFGGLLTMLSQYNFTIDENDPNDAEVGVDPEMLGRIFENLLEDNKDKGAYYTPKEIVQYMCRESLIAYLQTDKEDNDKERIRQFVTSHDAETLGELKEEIDQKLIDVKICDPAIGSGAFPMGLLRELFFCRSAIEPNIVENAANIKRHIIQNNIYGVDIERGAVDIARLRFWLSLIVDEKSPEALPNLDFKIMQGNSLLESYEGMDLSKLATMSDTRNYEPQRNLFGELENPQLKIVFTQTDKLKEFQSNLKLYFETTGHDERARLRKSIDDYVRDTIIYTLDTHRQSEEIIIKQIRQYSSLTDKQKKAIAEAESRIKHFNKAIAKIKEMELPNSQFFLWHTWFHDVFSRPSKEGFDIVIGNPPYINVERLDKTLKNLMFRIFDTCKGRTDIYIAFIEQALSLLKTNGTNSFIIPYAFTNQNYAELLRKKLVDNYSVDEIVDTSNYNVFDSASVKNIILRISKRKGEKTIIKNANKPLNFTQHNFETRVIDTVSFDLLKNCRFETKEFEPLLKLKTKIDCNCFKLEKIFLVAYGVRVNHKTDSSKPKSFYIHSDKQENYKPFTEGKNLERYSFGQFGWLDYQPNEHYNPMFTELFENEKIMFINVVSQRLRFAYDTNNFYNSHTVINCVRIDKLLGAKHISARKAIKEGSVELAKQYDTKFILGVLNSKLINWYFMKFQSEGLHFFPDDAKSLPIPYATPVYQQPIIDFVDTILAEKKQNPQADTSAWEANIDRLVYELYGVTEDEIKIMEGE